MSSHAGQTKKDIANDLINRLAGKDYGATEVAKAVPISISLPPDMLQRLEAAKAANKQAKSGAKTISGLIQQALEQAGY